MKNSLNALINNSSLFINRNFYLFLVVLFKYLFLKESESEKKDSLKKQKKERFLDAFILIINEKIIKNKSNYISKEYSIKNIKNIINFVRMQNKEIAWEILEHILFYTFSFAIVKEKYNHLILNKITEYKIDDLKSFFDEGKFKPKELNDIKQLLIYENIKNNEKDVINYKKDLVFLQFLSEIFKAKYLKCNKNKIKENQKNNIIDSNKKEEKDKQKNDIKDDSTFLSFSKNENISMINNGNIRNFLNSVLIYSQNNEPTLINENIRIQIHQNKLNLSREFGLYELSKIVLFNKNIKIIDFKKYFYNEVNFSDFSKANYNFKFYNDSVEELNLSCNGLKENNIENIIKLIPYFKGLKTLNLSENEVNGGVDSLFIALKKLYRMGKTKLENLFLCRAKLEESTYYELGELLKSKYCKLKKLYLNENIIPPQLKDLFFKQLKKNKSLNVIHLNENNINNNDIDDINRIISNTNIHELYLYKNKINNQFLKILYRTKFIKNEINNIQDDSTLYNIDLSKNEIIIKDNKNFELLIKILEKSTLSSIDISDNIYNRNNSKFKELLEKLENDRNIYISNKKMLSSTGIDIKRINCNLENKVKFELFDNKINKIIQDKNAESILFLMEKAKELIKDNNKIINNINNEKEKEEHTKLERKLADYMKLKRCKKVFNHLNNEIKKFKIIII